MLLPGYGAPETLHVVSQNATCLTRAHLAESRQASSGLRRVGPQILRGSPETAQRKNERYALTDERDEMNGKQAELVQAPYSATSSLKSPTEAPVPLRTRLVPRRVPTM